MFEATEAVLNRVTVQMQIFDISNHIKANLQFVKPLPSRNNISLPNWLFAFVASHQILKFHKELLK